MRVHLSLIINSKEGTIENVMCSYFLFYFLPRISPILSLHHLIGTIYFIRANGFLELSFFIAIACIRFIMSFI